MFTAELQGPAVELEHRVLVTALRLGAPVLPVRGLRQPGFAGRALGAQRAGPVEPGRLVSPRGPGTADGKFVGQLSDPMPVALAGADHTLSETSHMS
ncbi:hypothetical protein GCM10010381_53990 [Streptomyces xantholiticus]|nr:hypothetical protein GCM10010381_53990 [Streptomyces xantholiticus]